MVKFLLTKEQLQELYWDKKLSQTEIVSLHGYTQIMVSRKMRELGIPSRTPRQAMLNYQRKLTATHGSTYDKAVELLKADITRTYTSVGCELGVTRERIRQIANEAGLNRVPEGYISFLEMRKRMGYSYSGLNKVILRGEAPSIKVGGRYYIHRDSVRTKKCAICGKPLPRCRHHYCSTECAQIGIKRTQWRRFYIKCGVPVPKKYAKIG